MRLVELEPKWLLRDGRRIGIVFRCPNPERRKWWLTCFAEPTEHEVQHDAVMVAIGDSFNWVPCKETIGWTFHGGLIDFDSITVTPSLDAGAHMFHGYITDGEIK